jgi:hypothetical protein
MRQVAVDSTMKKSGVRVNKDAGRLAKIEFFIYDSNSVSHVFEGVTDLWG